MNLTALCSSVEDRHHSTAGAPSAIFLPLIPQPISPSPVAGFEVVFDLVLVPLRPLQCHRWPEPPD